AFFNSALTPPKIGEKHFEHNAKHTERKLGPEEIDDWRKRAAGGGDELREGIDWISSHARGGNAEARYMLAVLTASGIGVAQDLMAAVDCLCQAGEGGQPRAQGE